MLGWIVRMVTFSSPDEDRQDKVSKKAMMI